MALIRQGLDGHSILPVGIPAFTRSATQPTSVTAPSLFQSKAPEQKVPNLSAFAASPMPSCRKLLLHAACRLDSRADWIAGKSSPISTAMMEITTSISTKVNAPGRCPPRL